MYKLLIVHQGKTYTIRTGGFEVLMEHKTEFKKCDDYEIIVLTKVGNT